MLFNGFPFIDSKLGSIIKPKYSVFKYGAVSILNRPEYLARIFPPGVSKSSLNPASNPEIKSRFPFNVHAAAIKVYVRCEMSTIDTVSVLVDVYSNRQIIDNGKWTSINSISEWTLITIPISQKSSDVDSLEIRIVGGDSLETSFSLDEFSFDIISGIDIGTSPIWTLYPNPVKEKVKYELPECESNTMILFEIIDIYGRTVAMFEKFESKGEINLSGLASGTYVVKVNTGEEVLVKKVVKK